MRTALAVALASLLLACGGSSASIATSVSGNLRGKPLPQAYALAGVQDATGTAFSAIPQLTVVLTTDAGFQCGQIFSQGAKSAGTIVFSLATYGNKAWSVPTAGGDFSVTQLDPNNPPADGNSALALYQETDASCGVNKASLSKGTTGKVTLTKFSVLKGGAVTGTFQAIFDSGELVSGKFDTVVCPGGSADAGSCQ